MLRNRVGSLQVAGCAVALGMAGIGCGQEEPAAADGELLVSGARNAHSLALHDGRLFWFAASGIGTGAIRAVSVAGGSPADLATLPNVGQLAVRNGALYACSSAVNGEGAVYRVGIDDGAVEALGPVVHCAGFALDDDAAYVTDFFGQKIERTALATGEKSVLADNQLRPTAVVVDETVLYWINDDPDSAAGGVFTMPKLGGARRQLVSPDAWRDPRFDAQPQAVTLVLDESHVYVVVNNQNNLSASGALLKVSKSGGPATILALDSESPLDAAVDDTHLYWTRNRANRALLVDGEAEIPGAVVRIAKDGGEPEVLAEHQNRPQGVVLDETHVYWANQVSGNIRRAAKASR
jgi:sugar lactone lactonase YvrE